MLAGCSTEAISLEAALSEVQKSTQTEQVSKSETASQQASDCTEDTVYVYVCGEVEVSGVYMLDTGSRIAAAIEAAGGFTKDACVEAVNLAKPVEDGMQIIIPSRQEAEQAKVQQEKEALGFVNLNTATLSELCSLRGIGEAKAEAILAYRSQIGGFDSIEQLKEVTGIGESLFSKIKDSVYIE